MQAFLDNNWVTLFMTLWTIFALFGDDIKSLATPKSADTTFSILTIIAMFFFTLEIVLSCIFKPGYIFGFYFFLDVISTLTMLMDVTWFWNAIMPTTSAAGSQAKKVAQLARASRSARLGSKASKLVRVVRLIRMLRIVKLYKHSNAVLAKKEVTEEDEDDEILNDMMQRQAENNHEEDELDGSVPQESKLGKAMSDVTTKKVIIIVLLVMLTVPIFAFDTYLSETTSYKIGLDLITLYDSDYSGSSFKKVYDNYVNFHKDLRVPLIYAVARDYSYSNNVNIDNLRDSEKEIVAPTDEGIGDFYIAVFDLRPNTKLEAIFGSIQIGRAQV